MTDRNLRTAALGLMLMVALAACSATAAPSGVVTLESAGPGASGAPSPSASLDPETAQLAFAECMREHGIDMPDPQTSGGAGGFNVQIRGEGDRQEMQAAMEACDHFLEDAGGFRREADPAMLDRMVEFAGCMREHGIDMPDPNADGGITFGRGGDDGPVSGGLDPSSPEFKAAEEACRPILGDLGPGSGPTLEGGPAPAQP
jgi:hypothetical protein